jgi:hypothetical protein
VGVRLGLYLLSVLVAAGMLIFGAGFISLVTSPDLNGHVAVWLFLGLFVAALTLGVCSILVASVVMWHRSWLEKWEVVTGYAVCVGGLVPGLLMLFRILWP